MRPWIDVAIGYALIVLCIALMAYYVATGDGSPYHGAAAGGSPL